MLLNVKVLGGSECQVTRFFSTRFLCDLTDWFLQVEASPDTCVDHLKTLVESKLSFAKSDQKLLYKGKTLQGDNGLLRVCLSLLLLQPIFLF